MVDIISEGAPTTTGANAAVSDKFANFLKNTSGILSLLVVGGGILVLIGWTVDSNALKRVLPEYIAMNANAATGFVFCGMSLWFLQEKRSGQNSIRLSLMATSIVLCIGLLTLAEYVMGMNLGFDQLIFKEAKGAVYPNAPGRMAVLTAINLTCLGTALLLMGVNRKRLLTYNLVIFVMISSGISFAGYLLGANWRTSTVTLYFSMAFHASMMFLALSAGILFARPKDFCGILISTGPGGAIVRGMLPSIIVLQILISVLEIKLVGVDHDEAFEDAIISMALITIFAATVALAAGRLDGVDLVRRKNEEELSKSKEAINAIMDSTTETLAVFGLDDKFIAINEMGARRLGLRKEEIVGRSIYEFMPYETAKNRISKMRQAILNKNPVRFEDQRVGVHYENTCFPVIGKDGEVTGVSVFSTDVTAQRAAEKASRDNAQLMSVLISSVKDPIIVINDNGRVTLWNRAAAEIFGYAAEEAAGRELADLIIPARYKEEHKKHFDSFKHTGKGALIGRTVEVSAIKKNGDEFPVELSLASFRLNGAWNAVGTISDITGRKQAEQLMFRQEKLASIGVLSAGVAHEILNPLNIIGIIAQTMQLEKLPEGSQENLNEIMTQIRRATKITNNLRMFAHQHKPQITAVNVNELFDNTASLLEYDFQLDNVLIERDYEATPPVVLADPDLLAQVFLNLLNNAHHAFQEIQKAQKQIRIRTRVLGANVEIRLSDNGAGIPRNIIDKIFDPFFTTKDPQKGTGLGLSMAYSFIQSFGGQLRGESIKGKGATFIINIPGEGTPKTKEERGEENEKNPDN